jgi:hypothetical protein
MASLQERAEARAAARKARIQAVVAEMLAEEAAWGWDALDTNINDIENSMCEIGDAVAREYATLQLAKRMPQSVPPPCPTCGHASESRGQHERSLLTRRGEVPISEAKCYCPKCRRNFFPSVGNSGD